MSVKKCNPQFQFEILINKGEFEGQTVFLDLDLNDLLEDDISEHLIEEGYLKCWCNQDEYTILTQEVIIH